ncbi:hypothetical protein QFZ67_000855 [Streptomyces sp. V1I1]|nr:hypothetical protein [Streptomyces sp. V1I1]
MCSAVERRPCWGRFAFAFAMPALLFLTLSRSQLSDLATPGIAVFAASLLIVCAVGLLLGRWIFRRRQADRAIGAMAGAYVNSSNLGIPIAVHVPPEHRSRQGHRSAVHAAVDGVAVADRLAAHLTGSD